jgi:hypothetical protein
MIGIIDVLLSAVKVALDLTSMMLYFSGPSGLVSPAFLSVKD